MPLDWSVRYPVPMVLKPDWKTMVQESGGYYKPDQAGRLLFLMLGLFLFLNQ